MDPTTFSVKCRTKPPEPTRASALDLPHWIQVLSRHCPAWLSLYVGDQMKKGEYAGQRTIFERGLPGDWIGAGGMDRRRGSGSDKDSGSNNHRNGFGAAANRLRLGCLAS